MNGISRDEIQSAIEKSVELRALYAALMHGNTTNSIAASQFSAQNYPVFTPSYEDVPISMYNQISSESGPLCSKHWDYYDQEDENSEQSNFTLTRLDSHICPITDLDQTSPKTEFTTRSSRIESLVDFRSVSSSCNKCKPATIITESDNVAASKVHIPLTQSHSSHPKNRVMNLSKFFPRFKKKIKTEQTPSTRTESERMSQSFQDFGTSSIQTLKKELMEANEIRDKALVEVLEMRSSFGDLKRKLEHLETYCEDLKKALQHAASANNAQVHGSNNVMPVGEEAMVEGFLQIVSEARVSVKQFCKILISHFEEGDTALNALLQPHKLSVNSKYSKGALYHLEAIINQQLYQYFENSVFKKNGSQTRLDPKKDREIQFSSFTGLRYLSWNQVLRKGTKYYCEELGKFCDEKMSCIILALSWTKAWPEQLLEAFFVSAKCVWLLHLLAFSFNPPIGILRVDENREFDPSFMEDLLADKQRLHGSSRVKIMVMPGFYVQDKVLRCKVLCRYKSTT